MDLIGTSLAGVVMLRKHLSPVWCDPSAAVRKLQGKPEMEAKLYDIFKDLRQGLKKLW
jgi:hypothetical protein